MSVVNQLLAYITQIAFIGLGFLLILDYVRRGGPIRRDTALMFNSLGGAVAAGIINSLLERPIPLVSLASTLAIIAQPYLLIRLLRYFHPIPRTVVRAALAGMLVSWALVLASGTSLQRGPIVVIVLYFVVLNVYAMAAFVQGALITSGVVQQRLRYTAAGSGLLALALLSAGVGAALPDLRSATSLVTQLAAIASAIGFYLGFAAPSRLREAWQLRELRDYLLKLNRKRKPTTAAELYAILHQSVLRVTGSDDAHLLLRSENDAGWDLLDPENGERLASINAITEVEPYWQSRQSGAIRVRALGALTRDALRTGDAEQLFVVPLAREQLARGLILVYRKYGSLFVDDDLQILGLLAEHTAIVLENIELEKDLREHAVSLEKQAAHLRAVNKELEAFSYSVSHDLRAPLRAVDGFSQALLEDYEDVLDGMGKDFLHRIRRESQRMGQLIDDLIGLSRYTRSAMQVTEIDLSEMVDDIARELKGKEPERQVEMVIQAGVEACGDVRLMRVALENLVGNAWKYTGKTPDAKIEFGCTKHDTTIECFVRDNGAGFDMAYAHKLFGAFQRLHAMDEFSGTGIGLATVQRILHRHGGTVRAEGKVDHGATFYFTLERGGCSRKEVNDEQDLISRG